MRLLKRLWLRLELMHARYQIQHWAHQIHEAATDDRVMPADVAYMMGLQANWILAADDIRCDLTELYAVDHADDSEQLSKRCTGPLFNRH